MSSKTISLSEKAYQRLQAQRQGAGDSFSRIVMRARWEDESVTAGQLLELWSDEPSFFTDTELESIESAKQEQAEPVDNWSTR